MWKIGGGVLVPHGFIVDQIADIEVSSVNVSIAARGFRPCPTRTNNISLKRYIFEKAVFVIYQKPSLFFKKKHVLERESISIDGSLKGMNV